MSGRLSALGDSINPVIPPTYDLVWSVGLGLAVILIVVAVAVVVVLARGRTRPPAAWSDEELRAELRRREPPPGS